MDADVNEQLYMQL